MAQMATEEEKKAFDEATNKQATKLRKMSYVERQKHKNETLKKYVKMFGDTDDVPTFSVNWFARYAKMDTAIKMGKPIYYFTGIKLDKRLIEAGGSWDY